MEATAGPVDTAQQMAAGAAGCAIVKTSPGAEGRSAEMTQAEASGCAREGVCAGPSPLRLRDTERVPRLPAGADNERAVAGAASVEGRFCWIPKKRLLGLQVC